MVGSGSGKRRNSRRNRGMNVPLSGCGGGASVAISPQPLGKSVSWDGDSRSDLQLGYQLYLFAGIGKKPLVAKGSAVTARKDERRSREVHSPTPQPHALYTFQEREPFLERVRQFFSED